VGLSHVRSYRYSPRYTALNYNSYLPPPVLKILDDKSIEATKRAAMLTTALQWLFNKLPMAVVPVQMKPGVMVAKRFLPYVGYIGAAIAWSWSSVRGYDKGRCLYLVSVGYMLICR
jgi:hypothetical protein